MKLNVSVSDTIAAIATPQGVGAISIVRMSGPTAISIAGSVFRGRFRLLTTPSHTIRYGHIVDTDQDPVDEVLVSVFRAPKSYTGEDMIEISCHGGPFVTKKVLRTLLVAGGRLAEPGEFTKRAFLNGKLDLSQAEAVADLINAGSEKALRNSQAQLDGKLGRIASKIRDDLVKTCSLLELQLDFSEEDVAVAPRDSIASSLSQIISQLDAILSSFSLGRKIREGAAVAIVGRPNAGKSSVFNRLLMEERSIVSPHPGTTRDYLEESIAIGGIEIRLIDTAGLRTSSDSIEADGMKRTKKAIRNADLVVLVVDSSVDDTTPSDLSAVSAELNNDVPVVVVRNKIDLFPLRGDACADVSVSAITGEGFSRLQEVILRSLVGKDELKEVDYCLASDRHRETIIRCVRHSLSALEMVNSQVPLELIASELRLTVDAICEITGEITTDDILNEVFSRFCIGK